METRVEIKAQLTTPLGMIVRYKIKPFKGMWDLMATTGNRANYRRIDSYNGLTDALKALGDRITEGLEGDYL